MFFGAVIDGLLNPHMKDKLRYFTPDKCAVENEPKFYQELLHTANVIRTKMIAKERLKDWVHRRWSSSPSI
jgi:hypothetical protein